MQAVELASEVHSRRNRSRGGTRSTLHQDHRRRSRRRMRFCNYHRTEEALAVAVADAALVVAVVMGAVGVDRVAEGVELVVAAAGVGLEAVGEGWAAALMAASVASYADRSPRSPLRTRTHRSCSHSHRRRTSRPH